jgi:hypothetical protein
MIVRPPDQGVSGDTVRAVVSAVFRQRGYDRNIIPTLIERLWQWVYSVLNSMLTMVRHSGTARVVGYLLLGTILLALIVRIGIVGSSGNVAFRRGRGGRGRGGPDDPWGDADRFSQSGQYTDAAHALYRGLLDSMARRDQIQLHHSKTVGDYGRDLRRRSSTLAPPYRDFARSYETVVYGLGTCDRERYERLYALATTMIRPAA